MIYQKLNFYWYIEPGKYLWHGLSQVMTNAADIYSYYCMSDEYLTGP